MMKNYPKFILIIFTLILCGCTSYKEPKLLKGYEYNKQSPYADLTIELKNDAYPGVEDRLLEILRKTALFKNVNSVKSSNGTPDLIFELKSVKYEGPQCATPEFSVMIMSLGLVPTKSMDDVFYKLNIYSPKTSKRLDKDLEYTYIQSSYFGWLVCLMNISPNWAASSKLQKERNVEQFKYSLLLLEKDILPLVDRS